MRLKQDEALERLKIYRLCIDKLYLSLKSIHPMKKYNLVLVVLFSSLLANAQTYDVLIINSKIIDGTGNPWYYGDVAISNGKIAAIGKLGTMKAKKVIDGNGLIVAPGFIDVHAHIEGNDLKVPTADNFIYDGVTSVVTGNCGSSNLEIAKYFGQLDSVRTSINVATLIGHNTVRRAVMGDLQRDPTTDEQKKMEALITKAMEEGAVGMSTGLIYVPGTYSKTPEVVGLAKAASALSGVYSSHIRDEGDKVAEAVNEAISIGREAKIPVEISHFKVTSKPNFGRSKETIALVESARLEGLDVTIDQYPYVASSTTLDTTLPTWAFGGGRDSLKIRLANPVSRKKIKDEMLSLLENRKNTNFSYAVVSSFKPDTTYNGKNISEVNILKKRKATASDEAESILEMIIATDRTQMVFFSMDEGDLVRILQYPYNMIASDAGIAKMGSGVPHPRSYGTNARVIGRYVNDQKVLRLEEAIRRMTSLPAQKFKLNDRGLIRVGLAADIIVMDPSEVKDQSTFSKPHQFSKGFRYVLVNGQIVIDQGKHTKVRSGQNLKGPGYKQ